MCTIHKRNKILVFPVLFKQTEFDVVFFFSIEMPWPHKMVIFSGFSVEDISRCAFHIHEKW